MIVTIDGQTATGKSTIARNLSKRTQFLMMDTGIVFRAAALYEVIGEFNIKDFIDITGKYIGPFDFDIIKSEATAMDASNLSKIPFIQDMINQQVRNHVYDMLSHSQIDNIFVVGRNCGSVIFPRAEMKFYLTAKLSARVDRRSSELGEGSDPKLYKLVSERDIQDMNRKHGPLIAPKNSIIIDTSDKTIEDIEQVILKSIGWNG